MGVIANDVSLPRDGHCTRKSLLIWSHPYAVPIIINKMYKVN